MHWLTLSACGPFISHNTEKRILHRKGKISVNYQCQEHHQSCQFNSLAIHSFTSHKWEADVVSTQNKKSSTVFKMPFLRDYYKNRKKDFIHTQAQT